MRLQCSLDPFQVEKPVPLSEPCRSSVPATSSRACVSSGRRLPGAPAPRTCWALPSTPPAPGAVGKPPVGWAFRPGESSAGRAALARSLPKGIQRKLVSIYKLTTCCVNAFSASVWTLQH